ncbi:MAG: DNA topoisomerase (ATP-hydrolyzing) subunit A [Spirochaetaceae bacterium]|nr:DNA topoisomerase (ATP-hydrolyzing) subunit A [Spirochaetaceae bacterium]GMO18922.1 MAG: DNA topoisomerase (ATP-hydrolyzing) subunit A [Termitinemataceae bacterium]
MADTENQHINGKIIPVAIEDEVKTAYLNYAMSVIISRALPDARDGLKPVHRRILYSMDELGLRPGSAPKKSARIVGDTMGKYHPHGDMALYDALVRMAQDFSLRYPLVKGQGNFGSMDGDPPAAMRYTEARLSRAGDEMLVDLKKETVDFLPNFDESLREPSVLPAAIPNLLVNGSSGIAVGMATNMAPHNIVEVCDAVCAFIDNPEITISELSHYIKGPDFPTGGVIFGRRGIREAYETGRGKVLIRGKFVIETAKSGKETIVFTELPYNVNKKLLLERIGAMMREKEFDGIAYANDESDRDGVRVVIELKKGAIVKVVLNQLFAQTALQSTFGIINLALVNGKPQTLNLKELVSCFVSHRIEVIIRRTQYDLHKAQERENILNGLVITLANIDEVVSIIKASRDVEAAKTELKEKFLYPAIKKLPAGEVPLFDNNLPVKTPSVDEKVEAQAQAIVDMRLGRLTHLEVEKIEKELAGLKTQIAYYISLLSDEQKIRGVIKDETKNIVERFGDARRTEIVDGEIESIDIEDLIKKEEMMILISNLGYIKRVPVASYKNQGRGGKGMISAKLSEDDFIKQIFVASTHEYIMFITSEGKAYCMKVHELPEGTRTSKGAHLKGLLTVSPNEEITAIVSFKEFADDKFLFMGTSRGVVKKVMTSQFSNAKTKGVIAINLDEDDKLVSALLTGGNDEIVLISRHGQALRTGEDAVRAMGRQSRGVTGMRLDAEDELAGVLRVVPGETMLLLSEYGYGKRIDFDEFNAHGRATGGQKIYTITDKTGELTSCVNVHEDEEIMCITSQGKSIKLKVDTIRVMGRSAMGVRILNIEKPDFVVGVDRIVQDEDGVVENTNDV